MDGVQHALSTNDASRFRAVYQLVVLCVVSARFLLKSVKGNTYVARLMCMSEGDETFRTEHSPRVLFHFMLSNEQRSAFVS